MHCPWLSFYHLENNLTAHIVCDTSSFCYGGVVMTTTNVCVKGKEEVESWFFFSSCLFLLRGLRVYSFMHLWSETTVTTAASQVKNIFSPSYRLAVNTPHKIYIMLGGLHFIHQYFRKFSSKFCCLYCAFLSTTPQTKIVMIDAYSIKTTKPQGNHS